MKAIEIVVKRWACDICGFSRVISEVWSGGRSITICPICAIACAKAVFDTLEGVEFSVTKITDGYQSVHAER